MNNKKEKNISAATISKIEWKLHGTFEINNAETKKSNDRHTYLNKHMEAKSIVII